MALARAIRLSPSVEKQKLKLELLRGSKPKLENLPVSVVVHEHLVRAGCMFFGTTVLRGELSRGYTGFEVFFFFFFIYSSQTPVATGRIVGLSGGGARYTRPTCGLGVLMCLVHQEGIRERDKRAKRDG